MSKVTCQISISIDGYVAGPDQSLDDPLGKGGERLHEWAIQTEGWRASHGIEGGERNVDSEVAGKMLDGIGAFVMGRKMFGGGPGGWDESWRGWWGEDPPFHAPVYVLTHHPREPVEMQGGTTFHFVTDGLESALEQARAAAGAKDVGIAGGASTVNQALARRHRAETRRGRRLAGRDPRPLRRRLALHRCDEPADIRRRHRVGLAERVLHPGHIRLRPVGERVVDRAQELERG
jgi:dihydrofolate reductase